MPIPTPQQREYYVKVLPIDTVAVPLSLWTGKITILPNSDEYWCDGLTWQPFGTNSSTVGSLSSNSPILGNPPNLNTPAKLAAAAQNEETINTAQAAAIAALQTKMSNLDTDNDGRVDANKQQSNEYDFPAPLLVWNIAHNLGKRATVILLDSTGVEFLSEITYSDANTIIIRHSAPTSGRAILQ